MSGNAPPAKPHGATKPAAHTDRRVLQTREALGDALIALIQIQPFDEITVQQVLDRAGVGRSTFYAHYSDKNDLLLSDFEDFLEMVSGFLNKSGAPARRLAPVEEMFAHIGDSRRVREALAESGRLADFLELARGHFARSIEQRLRMAGLALEPVASKAHAHALSGSLFALLDWWLAHSNEASPAEMDALFHRMAWRGLEPASPSAPAPPIG